ncbi:hypothetical protein [Mycoplasmopsis adleri]|uniref:hypothetical protein n=1 Tax=Mycoplasmopsis adleri TaxID=51362 RepID=UPI003872D3E9
MLFKKEKDILIYKNDSFIGTLDNINKVKLESTKKISITFNDTKGWLGFRAIDLANTKDVIEFNFKENIKYDWQNKIKESSRHYSLIDLEIPDEKRIFFINECNKLLKEIREKSYDLLLTPFKGNDKNGSRRRRLDFKLARAIMEKAYNETMR